MKRNIKYLVFFVFIIFIVVIGNYYVETNSAYKLISADLNENIDYANLDLSKPIIIDMSKQNYIQRLIHPNTIVIKPISSSSIKNIGERPIFIQIEPMSFKDRIELKSSDIDFSSKSGKLTRPLMPGNTFEFSLILNIPKDVVSQKEICSGILRFNNVKNGMAMVAIPIKVINSHLY